MTFASIVNRECEKFRLSEIIPGMFKCFIFIQGLTASKDAEIRSRLLMKLEQDQKITLQNLMDECQRILNLRADMAKIEEQDIFHIHAVQNKPKCKKKETSFKINPCFGCGKLHLFKNCPFKNKEGKNRGNKGHKFSHCKKKPKSKIKNKNLIHCTIEQKAVKTIKRKYINV